MQRVDSPAGHPCVQFAFMEYVNMFAIIYITQRVTRMCLSAMFVEIYRNITFITKRYTFAKWFKGWDGRSISITPLRVYLYTHIINTRCCPVLHIQAHWNFVRQSIQHALYALPGAMFFFIPNGVELPTSWSIIWSFSAGIYHFKLYNFLSRK